MPIDSYDEALRFWFSRTNYEQLGMPQDLRTLKLSRMRLLLDLLGRPQDRFPIVHIAGTKGKGSTSAMLAAILRAAGWRVGLFTSPHLVRVEERIQVDGAPIPPEALTAAMRQVEAAVPQVEAAGEGPVTFFEVVTALGLLHFARSAAQIAVLEVGLGGRFDSTNVCMPAVSVITSISFDHMAQLGNTLAAIAREKAGIIKPGRPVVCGETKAEPRAEIRRAAEAHGAPLFELGTDFRFDAQPGAPGDERWPRVRFSSDAESADWLELRLWGEHQAANAALAWRTALLLRNQGLAVADAAIAEGLRRVEWPGRLEILGKKPWVVLDCGHNDASFVALTQWLRSALPARRRLLVLAMSRDKELAALMPLLTPHFDEAWLTRYTSSQRGAEPELLAEHWRAGGGGPHHVELAPEAAWNAARREAGPEDLVCVVGSVFLAGELRDTIRAALLRAQG